MSKELEGVLSLSRHRQYAFAPVGSHHHYSRAALNLFKPLAVAIIPTKTATAVSDYDVAIVHDLESSRLVVQFEFVQVALKSDLVFVDSVVLCYRKESISHWMEQTLRYCCVGVEIDLLNELLRVRVP